mgnify:CR=1 FL=1
MSEKRTLKSVLETIWVVIGSFVGAIIIIVLATTKFDFGESNETKLVENDSQENIKPVAEVALAGSALYLCLGL